MADPAEVKAKAKYDFLGTMYKAMWDNIDRHVTALWQSTAVLATAFGAALLIGRSSATSAGNLGAEPTADLAVSVVIAACAWLVCHAFDAANWFNRNIQIIGNIEAVFFEFMSVNERVHPYGDPNWRRPNEVLPYMKLQAAIGIVIGLSAFGWHFYNRVRPSLNTHNGFDFVRALPSIVAIISAAICIWFWRYNRKDFAKFLCDIKAYRASSGPGNGNASPAITPGLATSSYLGEPEHDEAKNDR